MYCIYCGTQLPENASFCPHCGKSCRLDSGILNPPEAVSRPPEANCPSAVLPMPETAAAPTVSAPESAPEPTAVPYLLGSSPMPEPGTPKEPKTRRHKLSGGAIVTIIFSGIALALLLTVIILLASGKASAPAGHDKPNPEQTKAPTSENKSYDYPEVTDRKGSLLKYSGMNMANFGLAQEQNGVIYFRGAWGCLFSSSDNGVSKTLLYDGDVRNINVCGNMLYFIAGPGNDFMTGEIMCLNLTTGEAVSLGLEAADFLVVLDDYLFFEDTDYRLCMARKDGTECRRVMESEDYVYEWVAYTDGYIYAIAEEDAFGRTLMRISLDALDDAQYLRGATFGKSVAYLSVCDGNVIFADDDERTVYSMDAETGASKKLLTYDSACRSIFGVYDDKLFFEYEEDGAYTLAYVETDGSQYTLNDAVPVMTIGSELYAVCAVDGYYFALDDYFDMLVISEDGEAWAYLDD